MSIQEELSMIKLESVEEAYQYAIKAEEKLNKIHEQRQRGRGGRFIGGRGYTERRGTNTDHNKDKQDKRTFRGTFFKCGGERHCAFECKKIEVTGRVAVVEVNPTGLDNKLEDGELLMMRRALCYTGGDEEPLQRKNLFKTRCKAIHDGRKNTYTIVANGMKQTLLPLEEPLKNEFYTNARICLVDGRKFMDGLRHENVCFALIPKKTKRPESEGEHSAEIKDLLTEYEDIVSDNVPDGLSPVRSISHCMDLVPGASLPNKAAPRLTLTENEELNRQVQDLLENGLIRESLSPCGVPSILAPKKNGEWRMCTDSRAINKITMKNQFPLPRMDDIMDCLSGEKYLQR
ncbi:hypothetical protein SUGI_0848680 [Cryptomeria japonica]|nr:hypothetical protein SUGI_0848680 [Cryptomeria japonica]